MSLTVNRRPVEYFTDLSTGEKIRILRLRQGKCRCNLALEVGVSLSALQRYEHGKTQIKAQTLKKLLECLHVSWEDFNDLNLLSIGEKIRILRLRKGKLLKNAAKAIGTSRSALQRYESGESAVCHEVLVELSEFLEVSVRTFYE